MPRITQSDIRRIMGNVPEDNVFRCHDGRLFRNLYELRSGLMNMSMETFAHHVTPDRNDFSNWVRYTIGDTKLANDLNKSANTINAARKIENRLSFLHSKSS
jgi:hypothetical protein